LKLIIERWQKYLNENMPGGQLRGTLAGISGTGRIPMAATGEPETSKPDKGPDLDMSVKAVLHRNGMVLLIKNDKGWDLPGGHVGQGENKIAALQREIFEETGLNISDINDLHINYGNKHFFSANFLTDDVILSDEHNKYNFYDLESIKNLDELSEEFKEVIFTCMNNSNNINENKLIINLRA